MFIFVFKKQMWKLILNYFELLFLKGKNSRNTPVLFVSYLYSLFEKFFYQYIDINKILKYNINIILKFILIFLI